MLATLTTNLVSRLTLVSRNNDKIPTEECNLDITGGSHVVSVIGASYLVVLKLGYCTKH